MCLSVLLLVVSWHLEEFLSQSDGLVSYLWNEWLMKAKKPNMDNKGWNGDLAKWNQDYWEMEKGEIKELEQGKVIRRVF